MVSSTPGGIEIGVRPSLDGRVVDAENCRRPCAGAASAGTRNEGSVMTADGERMVAAALVLLGASMFARENGVTRRLMAVYCGLASRRNSCFVREARKLPAVAYIIRSNR